MPPCVGETKRTGIRTYLLGGESPSGDPDFREGDGGRLVRADGAHIRGAPGSGDTDLLAGVLLGQAGTSCGCAKGLVLGKWKALGTNCYWKLMLLPG